MRLLDFEALTFTFDCYGTLIDWERGILEALFPLLKRHGVAVDDERLLTVFSESESKQQALTPTKAYPEILSAVLAEIASILRFNVTDEELGTFGQSVRDWPTFPDSADALAYLKRHYKLVIISNIDRKSFARSNAKLGVEFDAIITAEDVGSYKPDPRNFEFALTQLRQMGIAQNRVLHVAQSLFHDHEPAKSIGLSTVFVNRRAGRQGSGATPPPSSDVEPDFAVNDLAKLATMHRDEAS